LFIMATTPNPTVNLWYSGHTLMVTTVWSHDLYRVVCSTHILGVVWVLEVSVFFCFGGNVVQVVVFKFLLVDVDVDGARAVSSELSEVLGICVE